MNFFDQDLKKWFPSDGGAAEEAVSHGESGGESGSDGDSSWMGSIPDAEDEEGYYGAMQGMHNMYDMQDMQDMNDSLDATAADDAFGMVGEEGWASDDSGGGNGGNNGGGNGGGNGGSGGSDGEGDDHAGLVVVGHQIHPPPSWQAPLKHSLGVPLGCLEYDLSTTSSTSSNGLKLYVGPKGCDTLLFFLDVTRLDSLTPEDVRGR